ncbi:hypothetical protein [Neobacillus sp. D3-1R]|uniref:hypothetical protein n=1 Tax=Neobacillus sp. D3-1R TaxID=3445778 RepID=UPI003FA0C2BC
MNKVIPEKALQQPDYTLYRKLFSAVKNVENAVRLLAIDNLKLLQAIDHFSSMPSILSIQPLKQVLEESAPQHNIEFYVKVGNHLSSFERIIQPLWEEESLKETVEEIYFLIHQAYIELDKTEIQPFLVKKTSKIELFEDYLQSQIK